MDLNTFYPGDLSFEILHKGAMLPMSVNADFLAQDYTTQITGPKVAGLLSTDKGPVSGVLVKSVVGSFEVDLQDAAGGQISGMCALTLSNEDFKVLRNYSLEVFGSSSINVLAIGSGSVVKNPVYCVKDEDDTTDSTYAPGDPLYVSKHGCITSDSNAGGDKIGLVLNVGTDYIEHILY